MPSPPPPPHTHQKLGMSVPVSFHGKFTKKLHLFRGFEKFTGFNLSPFFIFRFYWGTVHSTYRVNYGTLIKKKVKFSSYRRNFRWERLQSHIWGRVYEEMRKYLVIYEVGLCNRSLLDFLIYKENFVFFFISILTIPVARCQHAERTGGSCLPTLSRAFCSSPPPSAQGGGRGGLYLISA